MLDDALARVLRLTEPPGLTVAGRTDAGVHAAGQVAHCDIPGSTWDEHGRRLLQRLRGVLPDDVRVTAVARAAEGFDARFSATSRRYRYLLCDDPTGVDPLKRGHVVWHRSPLDVDAMDAAASLLVGEHDFAPFCRKREGASTIRTLREFSWRRCADGLLEAGVVADAFCHNMVRSLVGACVVAGQGRRPAEWVGEVLASGERSPVVTVMPPHGLVLEEVTYPPDAELANRAREARQLRTLDS